MITKVIDENPKMVSELFLNFFLYIARRRTVYTYQGISSGSGSTKATYLLEMLVVLLLLPVINRFFWVFFIFIVVEEVVVVVCHGFRAILWIWLDQKDTAYRNILYSAEWQWEMLVMGLIGLGCGGIYNCVNGYNIWLFVNLSD